RGSRRMPSRADIDPLQFAWMLGDVSLVDVMRDAPDSELRFRFRLVGTHAVERFGYDMTGRWLDDLPEPAYRQHVHNAYAEVVRHGSPLIERLDMLLDRRRHDYEILRLPLGTDGSRVDMILLAVDFFDPGV
ncbi:MAG: PAS domain-containing protein, partial [Ferrovibrio sp.]